MIAARRESYVNIHLVFVFGLVVTALSFYGVAQEEKVWKATVFLGILIGPLFIVARSALAGQTERPKHE